MLDHVIIALTDSDVHRRVVLMSENSAILQDRNVLPYSRPETPGVRIPKIGFVGLGAMGYFMARNLARHRPSHPASLPPLLVWNRTTAKSVKLQQDVGKDHVHIAQSLIQVAQECDIIITNLANDEVVKGIYEEYSKALNVSIMQDSPRCFLTSISKLLQQGTRSLLRPVRYVY